MKMLELRAANQETATIQSLLRLPSKYVDSKVKSTCCSNQNKHSRKNLLLKNKKTLLEKLS
jgi:hypothetical protein